jgi:hypothetical protein
MSRSLLAIGAVGQGRRVFDRFCRGQDAALIADGGFENAKLSGGSPSGWQFTGEGGLDIRLEPGPGARGRAVVVDSTLPFRQVFASQALQLPPGRYRVSWRVPGRAGAWRVVARLTCRQGLGEFADVASAGANVSVDCPLQWLDLAIDPGPGPVRVDDVTVDPAI